MTKKDKSDRKKTGETQVVRSKRERKADVTGRET